MCSVHVSISISADLLAIKLMDVSTAIVAQSRLLDAESLDTGPEAQSTLDDVHCVDESKWVKIQLREIWLVFQLFENVSSSLADFQNGTKFRREIGLSNNPDFSIQST